MWPVGRKHHGPTPTTSRWSVAGRPYNSASTPAGRRGPGYLSPAARTPSRWTAIAPTRQTSVGTSPAASSSTISPAYPGPAFGHTLIRHGGVFWDGVGFWLRCENRLHLPQTYQRRAIG